MAIYPGGKVKNTGSGTANEDPRFTEFMEEAPKREVFVQDNNGQWVGTGMVMLSDNTLLAPEGFGAESGSVKFGDLINLSEASGYLAIYNYLEQSQYQMVDYHVPKNKASSKPTYVWLYEPENEFLAQPTDTTQLNANPLIFTYTTQLQSRVNAIKFKAYAAMSNVRLKITDVSSGVVVKYYPSKSSWEGDNNGVSFSVGENLINFNDSPLLFSPNTTLRYEITADSVSLSGNATGIPYVAGVLQRGEIITLADQKDIQTLQQNSFSGDYNALSNKPVIPSSTSQLSNDSGYVTNAQASMSSPVQSVNGQIGNVTIAVPAGQVNSDWNATSGVTQILNKPVLFSGAYADLSGKPALFSGNYADLTNKPVLFDGTYGSLTGKPSTFTPSAHTHVIGDVSGLQSALDGKVTTSSLSAYVTNSSLTATLTGYATTSTLTSGLSGKYNTPTGTTLQYIRGDGSIATFPTIPTLPNSVSAFINDSGYITNASLTGYRKVETFFGTTDANGNFNITFANTYSTPPDVQPQIIGGTFNQSVRVVSVSNTGCVVQAAQRNLTTLLSVEVLLAATVNLVGASITVQITPRS